ncbi:MAG TPA: malonyl-CoA decarboxylase [Burkholderiaceae bacterium]
MLEELKNAARKVQVERDLRGLLSQCRRLLSERGEANSVAIASSLVERFTALPDAQRTVFFERLSRDFSPDPKAVLESAQAYAGEPSATNLLRLTRLAESPRQELLRRINRSPGGTSSIVAMRRALLARLAKQPELQAVEADFLHLLSSWFSPGFLQLQRVDWNSPAQLLEQLIRHEAVHQIDGWDDLRRRLQPDRRCFAFFHPQLPHEPLIFVEVALLPEMPAAIAPLIDKASIPLPARQFKVAAFYSISNCQPGLRGVSLGNFLIKRVAEELKRELPQLKTFCTLSPIPGFASWVHAGAPCEGLPKARAERLAQARAALLAQCGGDLGALASTTALRALNPEATQALLRLCAYYLGLYTPTQGGDPVARFHLDNGARLERLNALADLSAKGTRQSFGLMVNYLYDLDRVEAHHEKFTQGEVAHSRALAALL